MNELFGKRLLVLAGASVHLKLVETAKEMGCYVVVTDNVHDSPAKRIADKAYDVDIYNYEGLLHICKIEKIDGVISSHIDPCQRAYQKLCTLGGYPCYGTGEQFHKLTDKHAFKQLCIKNGVDIIAEYNENEADRMDFPVFVKPVDSRGSRGQSVCFSKEGLSDAIVSARKESSNGDIVIEKYMQEANEFQVTYFLIDGKAHLIRTCDSYCGSEKNHMEKVVECSVSPSKFTDYYIHTAHMNVVKMIESLGIIHGPVFMQGFVDNGVFRFFDPGFRFPGVDYERVYKKVFGVDLMKTMILMAMGIEGQDSFLPDDSVLLNGMRAAILFPTIKAGVISEIDGIDQVLEMGEVVSFLPRYSIGQKIDWAYNVNQRFAEIDCISKDTASLKKAIDNIQRKMIIKDENGYDMTFEKFDVERIK